MKLSNFTLSGALAVAMGLAGAASAAPVCTTTISFPTGDGVVMDSGLGAGVCVQAQDKLFSNFSLSGLPAGGTVMFSLVTITGIDNHDVTFTNNFQPLNNYSFGYDVAVITPPLNNSITDLLADFTQTTGGPTTLTETATPTGSGSVDVTKNGISATGSNQITYALPGPTEIAVSGTLDVGTGSNVSAVLNTIIEQIQTTHVPEPGSLALLGSALVGLGAFRRRGKRR